MRKTNEIVTTEINLLAVSKNDVNIDVRDMARVTVMSDVSSIVTEKTKGKLLSRLHAVISKISRFLKLITRTSKYKKDSVTDNNIYVAANDEAIISFNHSGSTFLFIVNNE